MTVLPLLKLTAPLLGTRMIARLSFIRAIIPDYLSGALNIDPVNGYHAA